MNIKSGRDWDRRFSIAWYQNDPKNSDLSEKFIWTEVRDGKDVYLVPGIHKEDYRLEGRKVVIVDHINAQPAWTKNDLDYVWKMK